LKTTIVYFVFHSICIFHYPYNPGNVVAIGK